MLNGLNDDFKPVAADVAQGLIAGYGLKPDDTYLIHVGWDLARKNRRAVLDTFIALQKNAAASGVAPLVRLLVFVGPELSPEMAEIAARNGVSEQVKTVQNVSHAELRAFYARATALVFPSLQEGFGWPLIEAQACGCAVFVSDLAPMNEIGGEGAVYIDPADAAGIARAIEQAAPRLGEMRRMGLENAQHYTAQQMASNYIAAYRRVIEERKARP
ncbi:MAG: glycosyltransferase [Gammaproteobacteria bacterium]|nr:glycosyltransferase [Gammaproteobacteria bacterium]